MLTLLFYGQDGQAAKTRAASLRIGDMRVRPIHAEVCYQKQAFDSIDFMSDVSASEKARLCEIFGVPVPVPGVPLPPPPPASTDPLLNLSANWKSKPVADLKKLAAAVGEGRAVDNAEQAIAVIAAAIAARAAK